jgi:uncharacterized protein
MNNGLDFRPSMGLQTADEKQMGLFLHLSQLANIIFFPIGMILPIVLWQTQKEKMQGLDAHGKMVTNFMISMLIYGFIAIILCFVLIGLLLLPVLAIVGIVFPIIGGIKANNGELWEYPLTIKFLK